jgi:hypothetical protein
MSQESRVGFSIKCGDGSAMFNDKHRDMLLSARYASTSYAKRAEFIEAIRKVAESARALAYYGDHYSFDIRRYNEERRDDIKYYRQYMREAVEILAEMAGDELEPWNFHDVRKRPLPEGEE